jgi:uncharacterized protein
MNTTEAPTAGERLMAAMSTEAVLRTPFFFTVEPTRTMRAEGYEWDHELRVALPASYTHTTRTYPVLWVTDNMLETALDVLGFHFGGTELILVGVGPPAGVLTEFARRRTFDFYPREDPYPAGPGGDHLRREMATAQPDSRNWVGGGASRFLDFLVDQARPVLAADYRMDSDDHGLLGASAGGAFVGYSLFSRPGAFAKYIACCPVLSSSNGAIFELEERYAAEHDDLPAQVFLAAGEAEMIEPVIPGWGVVSSTAKLAETLSIRGYPSLRLTVRIFPGETHASVIPTALGWGVRTLWGDPVFGR